MWNVLICVKNTFFKHAQTSNNKWLYIMKNMEICLQTFGRKHSGMQSDTFYQLCLWFPVNCNHACHPEDDDKKDAEDWVDGPDECLA